ncbi:SAICAR synthase-like protein [Aureobasidium sp. EXF-12298]|nr:SAICAR synthase-like protein [Aureobasidium sp. EXF-12298]KAI4764011.1 SAICAR synthase-like protein [Aureobasidium sp. EXF-12344]KAI4780936.1 SAICAR synthase-like protein [Aureobasidium sp. EXF-3400]
MPSFLPDDRDHQNSFSPKSLSPPIPTQQQQQQTPAVDSLPGAWPKPTPGLPNGLQHGADSAISSLPNGRSLESHSTRGRTVSSKGSMPSMLSSKSDNDLKSVDMSSLPRDDDGYFAQKPNGVSRSPNLSQHALAVPEDVSPTSSALPLQTMPSPVLPPVSEAGPSTTDNMLRVPHSTHRASSPPAFSHTSSSMASVSSQPPGRLVHRHTLEVPSVAGRTSRDSQSPSTYDGNVVSVTGRFSPTTPSRRRGSSQLVRRGTRSIQSDAHLDEVVPDDDAVRWAEHIKQKRASKRKRDEDDERVVVGTKVDQNHVNWVTAYNMLTGIRFCVSRTNAKIDRDLTDADFDAKHKFSFDITGNELTPSAKYDFKFKDYAPWVFRRLRHKFGLDPADYLVSLTSKYILSELGSPGKSGSFFYFSRDYKYIIKTIHHAEHKFLRKILRDYYSHVQENPNTLLSQFYGLHRVKIPYGRKIHFVVMNNLFPPHRDIHRTFDLKGSTIGRDFREEELEKNPRATLKDLNWLRRNLHLEFGPTKKDAFVEQMQKDVALLQKLKIMDYSMLVGIHDLQRGNEDNLRDKTLQVFQPGGHKPEDQPPNMLMRTPSKLENARKAQELRELIKNEKPIPMGQSLDKMPDEMAGGHRKQSYFYSDDGGFRATHENDMPGDEIYYLGIIDCLTHYSMIKRFEHFFKGLSSPESQISAIPPERYGDRFIRFISGITKSRERAEAEKEQVLEQGSDRLNQAIHNIEGTLNDPQLSGVNILRSSDHNPAGTDKVMRKAEKQAEKSRHRGANEDDIPDRAIGAVRSPHAENDNMITLPVIGEAAENGSPSSRTPTRTITPQRSKESFSGRNGSAQTATRRVENGSQNLGEVPPPTPPKTDGPPSSKESIEFENHGRAVNNFSRPLTPPKDDKYSLRDQRDRPPTPPKDERYSLDKALPLPPSQKDGAHEDEVEALSARVSAL